MWQKVFLNKCSPLYRQGFRVCFEEFCYPLVEEVSQLEISVQKLYEPLPSGFVFKAHT
jgi:hypothetical protein